MNAQIKDLLKPEILNSISGLELIARIIVEGFMSGSNKSQAIGTGQEFSQYKGYQPGDDLRQLDWKMYARSERYFIKQADIETNITVKFIIDASHSMSYSEKKLSKLQYAKVLTAALAYLARKQSDTFGLFSVNNKQIHAVQPRFEQQQFIRLLNELILVKSEGTWRKSNDTEYLHDRHGKEMIIFITDLYDEEKDLLHFISRLKTPRNEVIVFQIMGDHEMDLSYEGSFTFQDLETKATRRVDTTDQRVTYINRVTEWIKKSRLWMYERQITSNLIRLSDPFEKSLRDFLRVRKSVIR
jgi:uncharacterized protein (DUF58 family)